MPTDNDTLFRGWRATWARRLDPVAFVLNQRTAQLQENVRRNNEMLSRWLIENRVRARG